jgi:hypothetical protein
MVYMSTAPMCSTRYTGRPLQPGLATFCCACPPQLHHSCVARLSNPPTHIFTSRLEGVHQTTATAVLPLSMIYSRHRRHGSWIVPARAGGCWSVVPCLTWWLLQLEAALL